MASSKTPGKLKINTRFSKYEIKYKTGKKYKNTIKIEKCSRIKKRNTKKKERPQKRKKNAIFLKSEINIKHPKEQSKKHNKKQAKI